MKRLFKKCRESGKSEFLALLDWRNTPSEGMTTSPAQRFLGRRCRTRLPMTGSLLKPKYPTTQDAHDINKQKAKQREYYDRQGKSLKPLRNGSAVRMKLPGQDKWTPAVCSGLVGPRRYQVETERGIFERNRKHILDAQETTDPQPQEEDDTPIPVGPPEGSVPGDPSSPQPSSIPIRRSQRRRQQPDWLVQQTN